ncbi:hypothetical protein [Adhaeribacter soli]|uniref:Uncharacterized protein n=1 Tax=Adhaeribacter soli TaxID=2607655 RepID=A0A5N1IS74_9BACT|nr:hypothetical protein [Adhaeribacter soli]KAA9332870.1 hypothetical protein F0P94_12820 [Adhaeribacter soli]
MEKYRTNGSLISNLITEFVQYELIRDNNLTRNGKRLIFLKYGQDVTKSFRHRWICGFGLNPPVQTINFSTNHLIVYDDLNLDCKFSISAMLDSSTIKSIKYFNSENEFIGEATFDSIGISKYGCRELNYIFLSKENETKKITLCDKKYFPYYAKNDKGDSTKILIDEYMGSISPNSSFIGCEFNTRVMHQIISLGKAIRDLYFL